MNADHANRRRTLYVDDSIVLRAQDRTGAIDAPYATIQAALAICPVDGSYGEGFPDFPVLQLQCGSYSGANFDRSVVLRGADSELTAVSGLAGSCSALLISDCVLSDLALETEYLRLRNCDYVGGAVAGHVQALQTSFETFACEGTMTARDCTFCQLTVTGDVELTNCQITGDLTVTSNAKLIGCTVESSLTVSEQLTATHSSLGTCAVDTVGLEFCNAASVTATSGMIVQSSVMALDGPAELVAINSLVMESQGAPTLVLCTPYPVIAPDVVTDTAAEALVKIQVARLLPSMSEEYSADVALGDVISQSATPGEALRAGETFSYVVSLGVDPEA